MSPFSLRQKTLSDIFIPTSRTKSSEMRMELLLQQGTHSNYCKALPLLGPPGTGKTHFIKEFGRLCEASHGVKLRWMYVEVTENATNKGLAGDVLAAAGDPDPSYGTQGERTTRAANLIRGKYDVIYLDEFHRLINAETEKIEKKAADWVTNFLNYRVCPVVMVGETRCERVFADSKQFEGRTFATALVRPFDWGLDSDRLEYQHILGAFEVLAGMPQRSDLHETDTALRFHVFSRGLLRLTADLVDIGAWVARRAGCPSIRSEHLAEAVDLIRVGGAARRLNPFRVASVNPVGPAPMIGTGDEE